MTDIAANRRARDAGLSYEDYRAHWREQKDASPKGKDPDERRRIHFLTYNWKRQARVHEEYTPSDELRDALDDVDEPQLWMVLTEPWCGDSAFLLPVVADAAQLHDDVALRILNRDDNLDVMDEYLTGGSRSIPKLVAFSEEGEELFTWGPRPEGARTLFADLREAHDEKRDAIAELLEYYRSGGWREADEELTTAVRSAMPVPSTE